MLYHSTSSISKIALCAVGTSLKATYIGTFGRGAPPEVPVTEVGQIGNVDVQEDPFAAIASLEHKFAQLMELITRHQ